MFKVNILIFKIPGINGSTFLLPHWSLGVVSCQDARTWVKVFCKTEGGY